MIKIGGIIGSGIKLLVAVLVNLCFHFGMALQIIYQAIGYNIALRNHLNICRQIGFDLILNKG